MDNKIKIEKVVRVEFRKLNWGEVNLPDNIKKIAIKNIKNRLKLSGEVMKVLKSSRRKLSKWELMAFFDNKIMHKFSLDYIELISRGYLDSRIFEDKIYITALHSIGNMLKGKSNHHRMCNPSEQEKVDRWIDKLTKEIIAGYWF